MFNELVERAHERLRRAQALGRRRRLSRGGGLGNHRHGQAATAGQPATGTTPTVNTPASTVTDTPAPTETVVSDSSLQAVTILTRVDYTKMDNQDGEEEKTS
ncbi:hypothetical protein CNMCM5793_009011 [Aspergillus hiratsukae]|uniref:Uncharacterized protein n=1 Tax=Aspergillus hiratsukae TaxID=1194566 RepID=A0A8H6UQU1_9EURO|nr:hypothetical protein CNMCM5793_009011 [Aspergillus hiratsukae]KAF7159980.1 hypothetical protein CNMCM6106_007395 [Aspergillus hiratsukae]